MSTWQPFAEELTIGRPLPKAPAITLDAGLAGHYQGICGDGLRLPLSAPLSQRVTGMERLANPAMVVHTAIGQSTVATRRVIANLFYRNVRLHRQVPVGTTLETTVTPTAAALARPHANGQRAKVLLSITTVDENGQTVLDFQRLALIPVEDPARFQAEGEIGAPETTLDLNSYRPQVPTGWDLGPMPAHQLPTVGTAVEDPLAEPVAEALALVRLTQNLAAAHRDVRRGQRGERLVYGGHTVGLAQASLSRIDPGCVTVLGWHSCNHLGPVFENDLLSFTATLDHAQPLPLPQGTLAAWTLTATALRPEAEPVPVLSWSPVVWTAATVSDTH